MSKKVSGPLNIIITIIPTSSSPKENKLEAQIDNESSASNKDVNFLDDIDIDEIVKYLNDNSENISDNNDKKTNKTVPNVKESYPEKISSKIAFPLGTNKSIIQSLQDNVNCNKKELKISESIDKKKEVTLSSNIIKKQVTIEALNNVQTNTNFKTIDAAECYKNTLKRSIDLITSGSTNSPKKVAKSQEITANQETIPIEFKNVISKNAPIKSVIVIGTNSHLIRKLELRMKNYLNRQFSVSPTLYEGKFSKIYRCKDNKDQEYVVKLLNKNASLGRLCIEKENMINMLQYDVGKNSFFARVLDSFTFEGHWCYLFDFYPKNLKEALLEKGGPFHIDEIQDLSRQLITALLILRNNNMVHADIKCGHILLNSSNTRMKLCGFDNSDYVNKKQILPNIGTTSYRAPETILGFSAGFGIDIWSSALVMYEMATAFKLIYGTYNNDILYRQMSVLGNMPTDMIIYSQYSSYHFFNGNFLRRGGYNGQEVTPISHFYKKNTIRNKPFQAYAKYWDGKRSAHQKEEDLVKLTAFVTLLEKMLNIHPGKRLPVEFVFADPFIYQIY